MASISALQVSAEGLVAELRARRADALLHFPFAAEHGLDRRWARSIGIDVALHILDAPSGCDEGTYVIARRSAPCFRVNAPMTAAFMAPVVLEYTGFSGGRVGLRLCGLPSSDLALAASGAPCLLLPLGYTDFPRSAVQLSVDQLASNSSGIRCDVTLAQLIAVTEGCVDPTAPVRAALLVGGGRPVPLVFASLSMYALISPRMPVAHCEARWEGAKLALARALLEWCVTDSSRIVNTCGAALLERSPPEHPAAERAMEALREMHRADIRAPFLAALSVALRFLSAAPALVMARQDANGTAVMRPSEERKLAGSEGTNMAGGRDGLHRNSLKDLSGIEAASLTLLVCDDPYDWEYCDAQATSRWRRVGVTALRIPDAADGVGMPTLSTGGAALIDLRRAPPPAAAVIAVLDVWSLALDIGWGGASSPKTTSDNDTCTAAPEVEEWWDQDEAWDAFGDGDGEALVFGESEELDSGETSVRGQPAMGGDAACSALLSRLAVVRFDGAYTAAELVSGSLKALALAAGPPCHPAADEDENCTSVGHGRRLLLSLGATYAAFAPLLHTLHAHAPPIRLRCLPSGCGTTAAGPCAFRSLLLQRCGIAVVDAPTAALAALTDSTSGPVWRAGLGGAGSGTGRPRSTNALLELGEWVCDAAELEELLAAAAEPGETPGPSAGTARRGGGTELAGEAVLLWPVCVHLGPEGFQLEVSGAPFLQPRAVAASPALLHDFVTCVGLVDKAQAGCGDAGATSTTKGDHRSLLEWLHGLESVGAIMPWRARLRSLGEAQAPEAAGRLMRTGARAAAHFAALALLREGGEGESPVSSAPSLLASLPVPLIQYDAAQRTAVASCVRRPTTPVLITGAPGSGRTCALLLCAVHGLLRGERVLLLSSCPAAVARSLYSLAEPLTQLAIWLGAPDLLSRLDQRFSRAREMAAPDDAAQLSASSEHLRRATAAGQSAAEALRARGTGGRGEPQLRVAEMQALQSAAAAATMQLLRALCAQVVAGVSRVLPPEEAEASVALRTHCRPPVAADGVVIAADALIGRPAVGCLLQRLCPLVIASPSELADWCGMADGGLSFDLLILDDADTFGVAAFASAASLLRQGAGRSIILSAAGDGHRQRVAPPRAGGLTPHETVALTGLRAAHGGSALGRHHLDGEYGPARSAPESIGAGGGRRAVLERPRRLLPVPASTEGALGLGHTSVRSSRGWAARRLANNLHASAGALTALLRRPLRPDEHALVHNEVRSLRGGLVNLGEAAALLSAALSLLLELPSASLCVSALTAEQLVLLSAATELTPALRSARQERRLLLEPLVTAARCDVLLVSCVLSPASAPRGGAAALPHLERALTALPRLHGRAFLSNLPRWVSSPATSPFHKAGVLLRALAVSPNAQPHCTPHHAVETGGLASGAEAGAPAWVGQLRSSLCALSLIDADSCRLVRFRFRGAELDGIAYGHSVALCHAACPKPLACEVGYGLLPQLLRRHGWRAVQHVFEPAVDPGIAPGDRDLVTALARDWLEAGELATLSVISATATSLTIGVRGAPLVSPMTLTRGHAQRLVPRIDVETHASPMPKTPRSVLAQAVATFEEDGLPAGAQCVYVLWLGQPPTAAARLEARTLPTPPPPPAVRIEATTGAELTLLCRLDAPANDAHVRYRATAALVPQGGMGHGEEQVGQETPGAMATAASAESELIAAESTTSETALRLGPLTHGARYTVHAWTLNSAGESSRWSSAWEVSPAAVPLSPSCSVVSLPLPDDSPEGGWGDPGVEDADGARDRGVAEDLDWRCAIEMGTGTASPSGAAPRPSGRNPRLARVASELLDEWVTRSLAGAKLDVPLLLQEARARLGLVAGPAVDSSIEEAMGEAPAPAGAQEALPQQVLAVLIEHLRAAAEPMRHSLPGCLYAILLWLAHLVVDLPGERGSSPGQARNHGVATHLTLAESLAPVPLDTSAPAGKSVCGWPFAAPPNFAALGARLPWLGPELTQTLEKYTFKAASAACADELVSLGLGCVASGSTLLLLDGSAENAPAELARAAHLVLPAFVDLRANGLGDKPADAILTGWTTRAAQHRVPLVMLQVTITHSASHRGAWFVHKARDAAPFFHPAAASALGLDGSAPESKTAFAQSRSGIGASLGCLELDCGLLAAAASGHSGETSLVESCLSILLPSSDRSAEKLSDSQALDTLSHAAAFRRASSAFATLVFGTPPRVPNSVGASAAPAPKSPTGGAFPLQLGSADSSQRLAISRAEVGDSYVLRGPPGCGKTQTLANVVCNQAALGKKVLVVAKLRGALGVLVAAVRKLAPQLHVLQASDIVLKSTGALRSAGDPANAVAADDRLRRLTSARGAGCLWQTADGSGRESLVRSLLRDGWSLAPRQPDGVMPFWEEGIVGVLVTKPRTKPRYVCSLCGKVCATLPPLLKHLNTHSGPSEDDEEEARRDADRGFARWWLATAEKEAVAAAAPASTSPDSSMPSPISRCQPCSLAELAAEALSRTPAGLSSISQDQLTRDLLARAYPAASADDHALLVQTACSLGVARARVARLTEEMSTAIAGLKTGLHALHTPCTQMADGASLELAAREISQGVVPLERRGAADSLDPLGSPGAGFALVAWRLARACTSPSTLTELQLRFIRMLRALPVATNAAACDIIRSCYAAFDESGSPCGEDDAVAPIGEGVRSAAIGLLDALGEVIEERDELCARCHAALAALRLQMLRGAIQTEPEFGHLLGTWGARVKALRSAEEARREACAELLVARTEADEAHAAAAHPHAASNLLAAFDSSGKREHRLHAALADGRSRSSGTGGEWRLLTALHPIIALTCDEAVRHLPSQAAGAPPFDVVVFDEASQIPTQQSLGCVGRAAQCIIAGDDRQLPPAGGLAGLLDDCLGSGLPLLPLEVHYRSASQSLIAVSNALFYHGSLASFPSAHDFALTTVRAPTHGAPHPPAPAAPSARGLCRVRVHGGMMSNYSSVAQDEISAMLSALPLRDRAAVAPRYTGSPQGFVNPQQAAVALGELASYLRKLPAGEPMSVGIITLNRPQRSLIHTMVDACKASLGLEPLADHAWRRPAEHATAADAILFIQSIDQIQGEERDLIIFSTLLAPRTACAPAGPLNFSSARAGDEGEAAAGPGGEAADASDTDEQDLDRLEVEHEASPTAEQQDDTSGAADNPAAAPPAARRAPKGSRVRRPAMAAESSAPSGGAAPRFSYSTIAHPHGDRLLNVGLTRAVRSMLVLFHPRMLAPQEHHPAPGKRAWGWLVRYLLVMPPRCACEQCASLFAALVPPSSPPASARVLDSLSLAETISGLVTAAGEASTGAVTELGGGGGGGSRSLLVSVAYGRVAEAPLGGRASLHATALLCDDARDQAVCVRDRFGLLPEVLRQKKAGWERVGLVSSLDLLGAFSTCAPCDGAQLLRALREASIAPPPASGNRDGVVLDASGCCTQSHPPPTSPVRACTPERQLLCTPVASPHTSLSPSTSESLRLSQQLPTPSAETPPFHAALSGHARDARAPPHLQDSLQGSPPPLPPTAPHLAWEDSPPPLPEDSPPPLPQASLLPLPEGLTPPLPNSPGAAAKVKAEPAIVTRRPKVKAEPTAGRGGKKAPVRLPTRGSSRWEGTQRVELSHAPSEPPVNTESSWRPRTSKPALTSKPAADARREPGAKDIENGGLTRDQHPRPQAVKGGSFMRFNSRADHDSETEDDGSDLDDFIKGADESASESEPSCSSNGEGDGSASDVSSSESESDGSGGDTSVEEEGADAPSGSGESGVEVRCASALRLPALAY